MPTDQQAVHTVAARVDRAKRGLTFVAGFTVLGVGLSGVYAGLGLGIPCWFKALTGWDCPFCGATRMGAALLYLDLAAAFAWNPLVFIGLVAMVLRAIGWLVELRRPLPIPKLRVPFRHWLPTIGWVLSGVVLVGYTFIRNLA